MGKYEDKVNYAERILKSSFFIGASIPFFFSIIVIPFFLRNSKTKELSEKHTKKWFEILFNIFNIKLELYGEKNTNLEKFIICSNHISFLDIPAITLAFKEKKNKVFCKRRCSENSRNRMGTENSEPSDSESKLSRIFNKRYNKGFR